MGLNKCPCIRVAGIMNNIFRRPDFHQFAFVYHGNPVTQVPGGGKAVGNEKESHLKCLADLR